MGLMETVIDIPAEHEANVFGQFDAYAKKIERALHVTFKERQHDPGTECRLHAGTGYGRQRRKRTGDR